MNTLKRHFHIKEVSGLTLIFLLLIKVSSCQNAGKDKPAVSDGYEILTPEPGPAPRINGPLVYGCRPGNPFIYRIPCQGERPVSFSAEALPQSLKLDTNTGIITGNAPGKGEYDVILKASNKHGKSTRSFKIVAGDKLALTPPMGWNHWYAHYNRITDKMMREAADIMLSSGMADVGYQYVNIDDCWMNAPKHKDSLRIGPARDELGNMLPNRHFPDMKGLADYIHSQGLKAGLYTSPGPLTCAGFTGSYQHEEQDACQFAEWGYDFLKYDWCSYRKIAAEMNPQDTVKNSRGRIQHSLETYIYPYKLMGDILKKQNRDIVYNLCQYGMGDVWEWGAETGAQCWRTADDLGYFLDKVYDVALKNAEHRQYSRPGEWNDPDYIQIGWIGTARVQTEPALTKMPPAMQYSYMSLWSLMASPLFYSGDMTRLDKFTLNILCNNEIIEVNQDPLGESASVIHHPDSSFIMIKNLYDGSKAVGLFNRGSQEKEVYALWSELGIEGRMVVRDLWRQKKMGNCNKKISVTIPPKGVYMLKISSMRGS